MSRIHHHTLSLKELVERSSCVVSVVKEEPFINRQAIDITPLRRKVLGKTCPPFIRMIFHFTVVDVLSDTPDVKRGDSLAVSAPEWEARLRQHKRYHLDGRSISPIAVTYQKTTRYPEKDEFLIFLRKHGHRYELAAEGAYETLSQKEHICDLLASRQKIDGG